MVIDEVDEGLPGNGVHEVRILNLIAPNGKADQEAQIVFETIREAVVDHALLELLDLVEDFEYLRIQVVLSHRLRDTKIKVFLERLPDVGRQCLRPLILDQILIVLCDMSLSLDPVRVRQRINIDECFEILDLVILVSLTAMDDQ